MSCFVVICMIIISVKDNNLFPLDFKIVPVIVTNMENAGY